MIERSRAIFLLFAVLLTSCEHKSPPSVVKRIATDATSSATTSATDNQSTRIAPKVVSIAGVPGSPVTASLSLDRVELLPGDVETIVVELQIKPGWHIYAMDGPTGIASPTQIDMELPTVIETSGKWTALPPVVDPDSSSGPVSIYHAIATFSTTAKVAADPGQGSFPLRVKIGYQACDRFSCRPYEELELTSEVRIVTQGGETCVGQTRKLGASECAID